ncbi:hypothetical protein [Streptomyces rubradiris]|uniref:Minor capsid protein n=1 Tax=Streptomyces rubradiris TaxID=285531 RepID=A0ABQ3R3R2_STRRR|nr:hypothetical protein [Streptomyces rubradiris]GHH30253.1 hypothetical protein GCM10018792_76510 [Streptomyces rubradiris]GHI50432.1 hypothetical protein Srubr_02780 [Streptomyces rubradiris]
MLLDVSTNARGPLFDGRARALANAYVDRLERNLAEEGLSILKREMRAVFRNPTGYYESRCVVVDGHKIWDSRVVYGPWLAGVGSRNFPVTRFKGYDHWIKTRHELNSRKRGIGERLLRRYTGRM